MQDINIKEYVKCRKETIRNLIKRYPRPPMLGIIKMNHDPASNAYVKGKLKDAAEVGCETKLIELSENTTQEQLLKVIDECNHDPNIDGFIVQLPLPEHIDENLIKNSISPEKDVDGFHPMSTLNPCTPQGIINYLETLDYDFTGKNAVVVGRSNIVGKPMAHLLLSKNCSVTIIHSRTPRLEQQKYIANADLIVVAVGRPALIDSSFHFKPSAVIVDVGINRIDGKLHGDCEPNLPVQLQTPVPGGVGLLTRVTLLDNLLTIYVNKNTGGSDER